MKKKSMRIEHLLISLVALLLSFLLFACGLLFLIFPDMTINLLMMGSLSLGMGIALLLVSVFAFRRRYLLIKMGGVAIHEKLVRHFAKEALQEFFHNRAIDCDVIIHKKGRVEILANIPYLPKERQEQKLEEIETALSAVLVKYCGCKESFIFNVSFS